MTIPMYLLLLCGIIKWNKYPLGGLGTTMRPHLAVGLWKWLYYNLWRRDENYAFMGQRMDTASYRVSLFLCLSMFFCLPLALPLCLCLSLSSHSRTSFHSFFSASHFSFAKVGMAAAVTEQVRLHNHRRGP